MQTDKRIAEFSRPFLLIFGFVGGGGGGGGVVFCCFCYFVCLLVKV